AYVEKRLSFYLTTTSFQRSYRPSLSLVPAAQDDTWVNRSNRGSRFPGLGEGRGGEPRSQAVQAGRSCASARRTQLSRVPLARADLGAPDSAARRWLVGLPQAISATGGGRAVSPAPDRAGC